MLGPLPGQLRGIMACLVLRATHASDGGKLELPPGVCWGDSYPCTRCVPAVPLQPVASTCSSAVLKEPDACSNETVKEHCCCCRCCCCCCWLLACMELGSYADLGPVRVQALQSWLVYDFVSHAFCPLHLAGSAWSISTFQS